MVCRLGSVNACERKLVKQIEVASATVEDAHNWPCVRLIPTSYKRGVTSASVQLDVEAAGRVRRRDSTVYDGDNLEQETGRAVCRDCRIGEIRIGKGNASVELRVAGGGAPFPGGRSLGRGGRSRRSARGATGPRPPPDRGVSRVRWSLSADLPLRQRGLQEVNRQNVVFLCGWPDRHVELVPDGLYRRVGNASQPAEALALQEGLPADAF